MTEPIQPKNPHIEAGFGVPEAAMVSSAQLHSLKEYRIESKHAEALRHADRLLSAETVEPDRFLYGMSNHERIVQYGSIAIDCNPTVSRGRKELDWIGKAIGLETDTIRSTVMRTADEESTSFVVGSGVALKVEKVGSSRFGRRFSVDKEVPLETRAASLNTMRERLETILEPHNENLASISTKLHAGETEAYGDKAYSFESDADYLIAFLTEGNVWEDAFFEGTPTASRRKYMEKLYDLPAHYAGELPPSGQWQGMYFDESGRFIKSLVKTLSPGVYLALRSTDPQATGDLSELSLQVGIEMDVEDFYTEQDYNYTRREMSVPFIETPTASELLASFDQVGLVLSDRLRDSFAEVGDIETRYGHGFSEITRELAKLVNDTARPLHKFFKDESEEAIRAKIAQLSEVSDPAAKDVITILRDIIDRKSVQAGDIGLPLSSTRIEIKDGACKDAEVYIAHGHRVKDENHLWVSSYNRPSVISLKPVLFNGVHLPAGSLFATEEDGFVFMRLTSFSYDEAEAMQVFGPQEAENRANTSLERVRSITHPQ